jgi:hypothetical protein
MAFLRLELLPQILSQPHQLLYKMPHGRMMCGEISSMTPPSLPILKHPQQIHFPLHPHYQQARQWYRDLSHQVRPAVQASIRAPQSLAPHRCQLRHSRRWRGHLPPIARYPRLQNQTITFRYQQLLPPCHHHLLLPYCLPRHPSAHLHRYNPPSLPDLHLVHPTTT